ncbi:MAG: thiamine phosphate synthase [Deltaproteobacteria bacterium]|nr:thiamine phosphate synthase [Deltaproteobacteria bacterium]MCW8894107.1 thiamine phosphate synthase [Deltaproteobacteria bacterium]
MHLHLVTDRGLTLGRSLIDIIRAAAGGGISAVQLREKECSTREFIELGHSIMKELRPLHIPLIINDRVDIALALGAHGVHLGQSDMPYLMARELLGPQAIIGLSVETLEQARDAERLDVDYLGLSPVFTTATKADLAPPLGLDGISRIRAESRHRLVAIGGISHENAAEVIMAGADGLAVVSAICSAADPQQASQLLVEKMRGC